MARSGHLAAVWSLSVAAALAAGGYDSDRHSTARASTRALSAEAQPPGGHIPHNQAFLVFRNRPAGYSIKYPEGWMQVGSGKEVSFRDKNNLVRIAVGSGAAPTAEQVAADPSRLRRSSRSLVVISPPKPVTINGNTMIRSRYATRSAPDPRTGKRITLIVDRYQLGRDGKAATVDLGTPRGVDNANAYRLIIESFSWS